ncbi:hypothetical protein L9F63_004383, partial [Diploptera punctata]
PCCLWDGNPILTDAGNSANWFIEGTGTHITISPYTLDNLVYTFCYFLYVLPLNRIVAFLSQYTFISSLFLEHFCLTWRCMDTDYGVWEMYNILLIFLLTKVKH